MLEVLRNIVLEVNAAESLDEALLIIVSRVRAAMGTEVCSVYMRDHDQPLYVFRATEGLNPQEIGRACQPGGRRRSRRPCCRARRARQPGRRRAAPQFPAPCPDIGEEPFNAFLGVPIIHQREVLGVLVVQQEERRRFDDERRGLPGHHVCAAGRRYRARRWSPVRYPMTSGRPQSASRRKHQWRARRAGDRDWYRGGDLAGIGSVRGAQAAH